MGLYKVHGIPIQRSMSHHTSGVDFQAMMFVSHTKQMCTHKASQRTVVEIHSCQKTTCTIDPNVFVTPSFACWTRIRRNYGKQLLSVCGELLCCFDHEADGSDKACWRSFRCSVHDRQPFWRSTSGAVVNRNGSAVSTPRFAVGVCQSAVVCTITLLSTNFASTHLLLQVIF